MPRTYAHLIDEVTEYLDGFLKPGLNPRSMAEQLCGSAEPTGDQIHIEVPSRYTLSGHPLPASFEAPDFECAE